MSTTTDSDSTDIEPLDDIDQRILYTIEGELRLGNRDYLEGGIPSARIHEAVDIQSGPLRDHLRTLTVRGYITQVWGVDPSNRRPREGYLPADHPDAGTPDPRLGGGR